jgi:hypothetical protein
MNEVSEQNDDDKIEDWNLDEDDDADMREYKKEMKEMKQIRGNPKESGT